MDELVNKSLARKNVPPLSDSECVWQVSYSVHNLQLTYLQEQSTDTTTLHKKLVDRYKHICEGTILLHGGERSGGGGEGDCGEKQRRLVIGGERSLLLTVQGTS